LEDFEGRKKEKRNYIQQIHIIIPIESLKGIHWYTH